MTVNATTTSATANYPYCLNPPTMSPAASGDVVYSLTLAAAGVLNVSVTAATGSTLLPNIDIRTDCTMASVGCVSTGTGAGAYSHPLAAGTYYVIVSGANCTSGAFSLQASLVAQTCGNGVVDPGEDCDPGMNPPANDGCGAPGAANECKFIAAPSSEDQCPGQAVAVPIGTTVLPASMGISTYGFKDDYIGSCQQSTGGLDRVFQLTPAASGTMTVSVGYQTDGVTPACPQGNQTGPYCWAPMIYARTACATAASEISGTCALGVNLATFSVIPATISFPVTANTPYWVFVDGYDNQYYSYGPFNFIVKLQ